ncbi:EAL domain-containing protein [Micromonospora sp. STR1s_5]|nr:EAL domain-containing protein [Micromonospora sp. STR1s_5]
MSKSSDRSWAKSELYHSICIAWIGVCVWLIGVQLELFHRLQQAALTHGLTDLVTLGCIMSVVLAAATASRSWELRKVIAAREEAQNQAQILARHDPLTGLSNRRVLRDSIAGATGKHALLLVDLDRFKPVNDVHGHPAGDAVLCEVSIRLGEIVQQRGIVARLGGDEFALFIPYRDHHELMPVAQQIITSLSKPFDFSTAQVNIGATVGIAQLPEDGSDASSLLRCADIALYRGKKEGRNTFRFFEAGMDDELKARAALEAELREAIVNGEIRPHYQPLVSLENQELLGFEILSRWYHPTRGVLSPDSFIDIAEDTGLITELSYRVLREACLDAKSWPAHLRLALNISPYQLKDRTLPERLLAILTETGFAPGRFEIEITETALAADLTTARIALTSLQNCGVKIALDDFGTGYSSLYHLRELRFDKIKIDKSFVQALNKDRDSTKIVDAIISLGKSLGLLTTAEGIENADNRDWLKEQGCTFGQGYLFGRAMSATAITELVADNTQRAPRPMEVLDISRAGPRKAA